MTGFELETTDVINDGSANYCPSVQVLATKVCYPDTLMKKKPKLGYY